LFGKWLLNGSDVGSMNPYQVTMNSNLNLTAVFVPEQYTLAVGIVGSGSVTNYPDLATYAHGTVVSLTAAPAVGWAFIGWSGDASGSTSPVTVSMTGDKIVTATFSSVTPMCNLLVNARGSGSTNPAPGLHYYSEETVVSIDALPAVGYRLGYWLLNGSNLGSYSPFSVKMTGNCNLTAVFVPRQYALTVGIVGQGLVAKNPDLGTYDYRTKVGLTATPAAGWAFTGWGGDVSGSLTAATVTMYGDKAVTATFSPIDLSSRILLVEVRGSGTTNPVPGSMAYTKGGIASVLAVPSSGYKLRYWLLNGTNVGSGNPYVVTMNVNYNLTAVFVPVEYSITIKTLGNGSVTKTPSQSTYQYNSSVTLNASADAGWIFAGWSGAASGSQPTATVMMTRDRVVTATFSQVSTAQVSICTLAIGVQGSGKINPSVGLHTYDKGLVVVVRVSPKSRYMFGYWLLNGTNVGSGNPYVVTMNVNYNLTAVFVHKPATRTKTDQKSSVFTQGFGHGAAFAAILIQCGALFSPSIVLSLQSFTTILIQFLASLYSSLTCFLQSSKSPLLLGAGKGRIRDIRGRFLIKT
jgi:uncharacterized repeat protein (TIGR02543 family)